MSLTHNGDLWLGTDSQEWEFRNDISWQSPSQVILFLLSERSSEFLVINQIVEICEIQMLDTKA